MVWLSPDSWLDRCGPLAAGLRADYAERGGEAELSEALRDDPRRLVALVGAPGVGTSRMALELARAADIAYYPDPLCAPRPEADAAALAERLAAADGAAAVVVLDGPNRDEVLARLARLVAEPIHPGLHVLVPCAPADARRLRRLAGGYPSGSILVASVAGEAAPSLVAELVRPAAVPFALLGRCPAGVFDGEAELLATGALARSDGEVVCLIDDRHRSEIVERYLIAANDGATRLRDILAAAPDRHLAAVIAMLRWSDDTPPAAQLLDPLLQLPANQYPDPLEFWDRAIPLAPQVVEGLIQRGRALLDATTDAFAQRRIEQHLALLRLRTDDRPPVPNLEQTDRDLELANAAGSYSARARALRQRVALLKAVPDLAEALASCREWLALETEHGTAAAQAATAMVAAGIASDLKQPDQALALLQRALAARQAIGDAMGQLFAHYRIAGVQFAVEDIDGTKQTLDTALGLAEHIGDHTGVGYCHWLLGSLADKAADPEQADRHYSAAIDAYAQAGPVPPRLLQRQRTASIAAEGVRELEREGAPLPAEDVATPRPPVATEPAGPPDLLQLLVRRTEKKDQ